MRWDLKELRNNVENLFGESQRSLLTPSLESIVNRRNYSRYHFQEFERLLSEFLSNKQDEISLLKLVFGINEEEIGDFSLYRIQAEANILACLQSMHSVTDILSHVIYYSFNMNNNTIQQMAKRKVSIHSVQKNSPNSQNL